MRRAASYGRRLPSPRLGVALLIAALAMPPALAVPVPVVRVDRNQRGDRGELIDHARLSSGVALPYPTRHLFRGFGPCIGHGRHRHEALDLGGVGPDSGVGTPVRSMVKARIVMIGSTLKTPKDFGTPYTGARPIVRGGRKIPGSKEIPGYGKVWFFTSRRGKWRSGNIIQTIGLEPPLEGAVIRYMHLAAVRPDLKPGDVLEAGEELGLLGGTGVQDAGPHVHIDVRMGDGTPVDIAPLLGLAPTASCGEAKDNAIIAADDFEEATPVGPEPPERWPAGPAGDATPPLELDPPPPPWRVGGSAAGGAAGAGGAAVIDVAAQPIEIAGCAMFERVAQGPADLRTRLWQHRFLELSLAAADGSAKEPALELWDVGTKTRIMPGATTPIAVSELPAEHGAPARLRLVVADTTEVALVIRGDVAWHLRIAEKCKRPEPEPDVRKPAQPVQVEAPR